YLYTRGGLISLRYDGTDRRTHLQVKSPPLGFSDEPDPADDVLASPDGNWVLAHIMNQLYVTAMPEVGGEAPTIMVNAASVPLKKITDIGADYFAWADGGKTITWAIGPSFFRQSLSSISFEPPKEEKKEGEEKDEAKKDADKKDAGAADAQKKDETKKDEQAEKKPEKFKEQEKSVEEFRVDLEFPRKILKSTIVLRGATVITMKRHHARLRRHPRALVRDSPRHPRYPKLELPRQRRLWRDHRPRRPDRHQRHVRLRRPRRHRRHHRLARFLHRPRRFLQQQFPIRRRSKGRAH